jgi:hypothetical protein
LFNDYPPHPQPPVPCAAAHVELPQFCVAVQEDGVGLADLMLGASGCALLPFPEALPVSCGWSWESYCIVNMAFTANVAVTNTTATTTNIKMVFIPSFFILSFLLLS